MELTALERTFFDDVLRIQLDVPMNATLTVQDESIDMIVVPEITNDGHFEFKFFNATPYHPQAENGVITFTENEIFGVHPSLETAWLRDEVVKLNLKKSVSFPPQENTFDINAEVLYTGPSHMGRLSLERNIVALEESPFTETRFSLRNFPDFKYGYSFPDPTFFANAKKFYDDELPNGWSFTLKRPPSRITLDGDEGWYITITKEETETRGLITHTGVIAFLDNRAYSTDALNEILTGLGTFFAFVAGQHCFPTVTVGYNEGRRPVWGRIARFPDARHKRFNWFVNSQDIPQGAYLEVLFPKFWEKWNVKSKEISVAIDLYIRSATSRQHGNRLGAIGESYAALETLASLVQGKTIHSNSAKHINEVLEEKGIPHRSVEGLNLPVFTKLGKILNGQCEEGVFLLNRVRNYDSHPLGSRTQAEIKPDVHDVSQNEARLLVYLHDLSQFYFEHLFLAYCGFGDTKAKTEFGCFRPLLAELNSV